MLYFSFSFISVAIKKLSKSIKPAYYKANQSRCLSHVTVKEENATFKLSNETEYRLCLLHTYFLLNIFGN